MEYRFWVNIIN